MQRVPVEHDRAVGPQQRAPGRGHVVGPEVDGYVGQQQLGLRVPDPQLVVAVLLPDEGEVAAIIGELGPQPAADDLGGRSGSPARAV